MNEQLETPEIVETLKPNPRTKPRTAPARVPAVSPRSTVPPTPGRMPVRTAFDDNEEEDDSFIGRHGGKLAVVVLLTVAGAIAYFVSKEKSAPVRKAPERVVTIQMAPPPPPPPPPPPKVQPPPPPEQKMTEVTPVEDEPEPDPKPADEPPAGLDTNIKGDGAPGGMTLPGGGGGRGGMIGGGDGGRRGNPHGYYFGQVQKRIADKLGQNKKTRTARFSALQVRIWPDATGRVTRAQLLSSTGDAALDAAIRDEVLSGMQLHEPLPQGVKPPVVLRINARRNN